ncbi:hypothetical protein BACCIP111883_04296 [Sutcliffiella rhizosphaerae]|uniref:Uncharacterized protein n=1 Tax=Sutcliffiella rhizosphaerae TaxID=2880967 RepID=A0ABM8YU35_9BACI|nr:hypothetical protein BACCIP111883_04296 [Sutcliffiella rhizosphaerae]
MEIKKLELMNVREIWRSEPRKVEFTTLLLLEKIAVPYN